MVEGPGVGIDILWIRKGLLVGVMSGFNAEGFSEGDRLIMGDFVSGLSIIDVEG